MTKLSSSEIETIANLARLELTNTQLSQITIEVRSILEFVKVLQSIDTAKITPTAQVTGLNTVWREDEVRKCEIPPDQILALAPALYDNFIKVQKVL